MTFTVNKASDFLGEWSEREINTIDDLKALDEEFGNNGLIIHFKQFPTSLFDENQITIYDDYME